MSCPTIKLLIIDGKALEDVLADHNDGFFMSRTRSEHSMSFFDGDVRASILVCELTQSVQSSYVPLHNHVINQRVVHGITTIDVFNSHATAIIYEPIKCLILTLLPRVSWRSIC